MKIPSFLKNRRLIKSPGTITRLQAVNFKKKIRLLLDIGCADGTITWEVSKKEQVFAVGIEPVINRLKLARHKINSIRAVGEALPIKSKTFDKIICLAALDHVEEPHLVVKEMIRVLKSPGEIIITVPCLKEPVILKKTLRRILKKWGVLHTPYTKIMINEWFEGEDVHFQIDQYPGAFSSLTSIIWVMLQDFREQMRINLKLEMMALPFFHVLRFFEKDTTSHFGLSYRVHVYKTELLSNDPVQRAQDITSSTTNLNTSQ